MFCSNMKIIEEDIQRKKDIAVNKIDIMISNNVDKEYSSSVFTNTLFKTSGLNNTLAASIVSESNMIYEDNMKSTIIGIIDKYINIFDDIYNSSVEKVDAICDSLKDKLNDIAIPDQEIITLPFGICRYQNLTYMIMDTSMRILLEEQLKSILADSQDEISSMSKKEFISYIRSKIFNVSINDKELYIRTLYNFFRDDNNSENYYTISTNELRNTIDSSSTLFNNAHIAMESIKQYKIALENFKTIVEQSDLNNDNDIINIIASRINIICENFALLNAARADAIIEYVDTMRNILMYLYNGGK